LTLQGTQAYAGASASGEENGVTACVKNDDEKRAFRAAVIPLQQAGAIRRCLQLLAKRSHELEPDAKADLDGIRRRQELPGYRVGRAPLNALWNFAAKNPGFEQWLFTYVFRFWVELHRGFPETVQGVARKLASSVDFDHGDWTTIAETADAVHARMPRHTRQDVLLGLFAHRFQNAYPGRHRDDEDAATISPPGGTTAPSLPSSEGNDLMPSDSDAGPVASSAPVEVRTAPEIELSRRLESLVVEFETVEPASPIWDETLPGFLDRLGELAAQKIEARAAKTARASLALALADLKLRTTEDLAFLRLGGQVELWSSEAVSASDVPAALERLTRLGSAIEEHRSARVAAQHAESDEDLETQTSLRQGAKRDVLALVTAIDLMLHMEPQSLKEAPHNESDRSVPSNTRVEMDGMGVATATNGTENAGAASTAEASVVDPGAREPDVESATPRAIGSQPGLGSEPRPEASGSPVIVARGDAESPAGSSGSDVPEALARRSEYPAPAITEVSPELVSYDDFREAFWLGSTGNVEPAPWHSATFADALVTAANTTLLDGPTRAWQLLVCARALELLGAPSPIASQDVRSAAALWAAPDSPSAGLEPERCERLRAGSPEPRTPAHRIALVLEALRPSRERRLLAHEIEALIDHAGFESGALRVVVHRLLGAHALGHDAISLLRDAHDAKPEQARDLVARLEQERRDLQTLVTKVWSAAGGRVQRTHCRRAWSDFIDEVHPWLTRMYPAPRGDDNWTISDASSEIDGLTSTLDAICERYAAKFDDKRHMLRTAAEIADAARRVLELRRRQLVAANAKRPVIDLPRVELQQLGGMQLTTPAEDFGRRLLLRVIDGTANTPDAPHPLAITIGDVCERPDILRVIKDVPPESASALRRSAAAFAYADDLAEPVRAAAVLVHRPETPEERSLDALVAALERSHRSPLLGAIIHVLDERLRKRIHAERTDDLGRLASLVSYISTDVAAFVELGSHLAGGFRRIRDRARELLETGDVRLDTRLMEVWLERVHEAAERCIQEHVAHLTSESSRREDGDEVRSSLARKQYSRAIRMLYGHTGVELRTNRQTEWRGDVSASRDALLKRLFTGADAKLRPLVEAWRAGVKGDAVRSDRTLRTEFARVVTEGRNLDRESAPAFIAIPMMAINAELTRDQLMPTFIPQVFRFGRLVLATPPVSTDAPSFRQNTIARAAEFPQDLVVFLTPRLTDVRRTEALTEMRRRGTAAALIDDVDLVRLVNPGGQRPHLLLGLLEIALEQQRRAACSPFELPEGSLTRQEMYVGRREKARDLARTANYSRLFSGRKLGKSALLRFIERTEDGAQLPSGNLLRVIYVPAVGIESESAMVDAIATSLESALAMKFARHPEATPADRLDAVLREYLGRNTRGSLLVVLDEADVFFERQLEAYEEHRERCLSFQMRSRFTAMTDEQGLPRIRFIFAGYRVTNRSQGAWSNWGLVLSLEPLEPEDAARLVAAPLAVMGIDLGAHAHEVAYRCGYQPAILLRFGERLIDQLERQPHRSGERHVVTEADVAQALEDQRVQEEILTITRNNFEGNPVGLIVFSALLSEFVELPPGQPLRDAPQRILERLRKIDPDLAWLEREGDGSGTVRGYLSDFVERSLLRERRVGGEPSYSLRFPHHLTIIASLSEPARIREELRRVRARGGDAAESAERALLPPHVLRDLGDAMKPRSGAIAVLGTLWPAGAYDPNGGVPDRLGVTSDEILDGQALLEAGRSPTSARVLRRVDVALAEHFLDELRGAASRPLLMGGVDLLRWALARRKAEQTLIFEVHGVGRLSRGRLAWWLQRVRGLEFAHTDAIERIHAATGGIPMLLDTVDSQLKGAAGTTVSDERLQLALSTVDEALPTVARNLATGRPSVVLERREREILQLVECVVCADASAGRDLKTALTEVWELFAERCSIPPVGAGDAAPLEVLLEVGLLPVNPSGRGDDPVGRIGVVTPADPVLQVARALAADRR
jgi:hypothetical protein